MPQISSANLNNQTIQGERVPAGISRSSQALFLTALNSIQEMELGTGTGVASNELYQMAIRTYKAFYVGSSRSSFSRSNSKEIIHREISPTLSEIYNLLTWPDGWNGYDACAPKYRAVQYAEHWIELFYQEVMDSAWDWLEPNVTASAEGEVVFEWRHGIKVLTIFIGNEIAEYVKDWGADVNTEMEDGQANSPNIRKALWNWLMN